VRILSEDFVSLKRRFYVLLHPRLTVLITTYCGGDKYNVMPCSWHTPVSWEPNLILVVIDKENFTHECIMNTKEFVVNVIDDTYLNKIMKLTVHGKRVDKFKRVGIETIKAKYVKAPIIKDALGYLEAKVYKTVDLEEETIFIGEVLHAAMRKDVYYKGGWNYNNARLIFHHWDNYFIKLDPKSFTEAPE